MKAADGHATGGEGEADGYAGVARAITRCQGDHHDKQCQHRQGKEHPLGGLDLSAVRHGRGQGFWGKHKDGAGDNKCCDKPSHDTNLN